MRKRELKLMIENLQYANTKLAEENELIKKDMESVKGDKEKIKNDKEVKDFIKMKKSELIALSAEDRDLIKLKLLMILCGGELKDD